MSCRGRKGFGEAGTSLEQEKDPLMKRELLELVRSFYKIREVRVRKRLFEMVKAAGAAGPAEVLARPKGQQLQARFQLIRVKTIGGSRTRGVTDAVGHDRMRLTMVRRESAALCFV
jgi:hypothetical protein